MCGVGSPIWRLCPLYILENLGRRWFFPFFYRATTHYSKRYSLRSIWYRNEKHLHNLNKNWIKCAVTTFCLSFSSLVAIGLLLRENSNDCVLKCKFTHYTCFLDAIDSSIIIAYGYIVTAYLMATSTKCYATMKEKTKDYIWKFVGGSAIRRYIFSCKHKLYAPWNIHMFNVDPAPQRYRRASLIFMCIAILYSLYIFPRKNVNALISSKKKNLFL